MKVRKILHKVGTGLKRSSPTILTSIGAAGVVATSIFAVKATPPALDALEKEYYRRWEKNAETDIRNVPEPLTPFETFKVAWRFYVPTVAIGSATIACIFGANVLNKKQQASIASVYAMLDQSYKQYRNAANEYYGPDADANIKAQMAKSTYVSHDGYRVYNPDLDEASENVFFYDLYSERFFEAKMAAVINAIYHLNRNWQLKGESTVNEFYKFLGIDEIPGGDEIGWADEFAEQGFMWIDFNIDKTEIDETMECFVISPVIEPEMLYVQGD
jgi:hypothetical protein